MDIAKYAVHVSERGPEKNTSREKTRQEIWEGSTAHSLKKPFLRRLEGFTARRSRPTFTKHVFQHSTVNSK